MSDFLYNIAIEAPTGSVLIDWGREAGWLDKYRELLATAQRLSFLPKEEQANLPIVSITLTPTRRWIIFSRVFGNLSGSGQSVRLYCLGYQETLAGHNLKTLLWVYPNGTVEAAEDPSFWQAFL